MTASNAAVAPPLEPPDEPRAAGQVERKARALIGWMNPEEAQRLLLANVEDPRPPEGRLAAIQDARSAVTAREEGVDQADLVTDRPRELDSHVDTLRSDPAVAPMFAEGWDVSLVDLRRVCAFQPVVFSEHALQRVDGIDADDMAALAAITLPVSADGQLPVQFDHVRQAFIVSSANPNLRVIGATSMPTGPNGAPLFGFGVDVSRSFVQVARYRKRYFLRDGYHRAFGFLTRGINVVPALARDLNAFEELMPDPRMMLPQDGYRGPRPPVLTDYLDDVVAATVRVPAFHKMVVVQALELTPIAASRVR